VAKQQTTYGEWMVQEGIPIVTGHGVTDVMALELGDWERLGGRGAYLQLMGLEGLTGMYVGEIPPGGTLKPEKHMFEELIYVVSGRGAAEVWPGNQDQAQGRTTFEWKAGSLFAPPANSWHRLFNGSGTEPARFLAVTTEPIVMDLFHSPDFVFNCDYAFADRFNGQSDYYKVGERRFDADSRNPRMVWETNFIPDVPGAALDQGESKGPGNLSTHYEMSGNVLVGHMTEWPVGRYHKAHYHGGGAVLMVVRSKGYSIMWPSELGLRPYENGYGDQVVRVDWQVGSVFSPPTGWFHQHFNIGHEPARQLALRYGSHNYGVQFHDVQSRVSCSISTRVGGTLIELEDEDPEIRRLYQEEIARLGIEYRMPALAVA